MAVVTHRDNPVQNLSSNELARILGGETRKWRDSTKLILVLHKSSAEENETIQRVCRKNQAQRKAFLLKHKDAILWVDSDADVINTSAIDWLARFMLVVRHLNGECQRNKTDATRSCKRLAAAYAVRTPNDPARG